MVFKKGCIPWNKGLTKETDSSIFKQSQAFKLLYEKGYVSPTKGRKHTEEEKSKIKANRKPLSKITLERLSLLNQGSKNPNWKGDRIKPNSGRERAQKLYSCLRGKERHHKDGNPLNNNPENMEFLTRKEHMIKDGRLERSRKRTESVARWFHKLRQGKTLEEIYGLEKANEIKNKIGTKMEGNKNVKKRRFRREEVLKNV